jgi:CSLREA domain-containing protein
VVAVAVFLGMAVFGLTLPALAAAESFIVDSAADEADLAKGSGGCATAAGTCTLRAAIEEADALPGESSEIEFAEEVFSGGAGATIALGSPLPPIIAPLRINGHLCGTALGVEGPCVAVEGPPAGTALRVDGAAEVEIAGLAVAGAEVGIEAVGAEAFRASRDWFGVTPTGATGGDGIGLIVGLGSDGARIGTEGLVAGNVFAGGGEGLRILGAAGAKVLSNYFGVLPDGTTPAPITGADIAVASTPGHEATGTAIGTNLKPAALATSECDRGCNVIAGAGTSGIDLSGGAGTGPPAATTIAGNFIGLDAAGTETVANATAGITVGAAAATVIGGPRLGEANYIAGGVTGIRSGPAAPDLVVRGNAIGIAPVSAAVEAPSAVGVSIDSGTLPSVALEATVVGNRLRMGGGVGISARGFGATIAGNSLVGGAIGVRTLEPDGNHGNAISGNSVSGATAGGIVVENELNVVAGNEVSASGAAGIRVDSSNVAEGVSGNLIGGDSTAAENSISGSAGAAIEILDRESTETEVARNHGSQNGGPFIALTRSSSADAKGPNFGIAPPVISTATGMGAGGSGAKPEALVRVFAKQLPEAGELASFLGEVRADASGNWQLVFPQSVPPGTTIAATQTGIEEGTSELAVATVSGGGAEGGNGSPTGESGGGGGSGDNVGPPAGGGSQGDQGSGAPSSGGPAPAPEAGRPQTWVLTGTRQGTRRRGAHFAFSSDQVGARFQCRIDRGPFRPCHSPRRYRHVGRGKHLFEVRAIGLSGAVDPTPAKWRFTIR